MKLTMMSLALVLAAAPLAAETHRFTPTVFYTTYSFAHPPALRIKPGEGLGVGVGCVVGRSSINARR